MRRLLAALCGLMTFLASPQPAALASDGGVHHHHSRCDYCAARLAPGEREGRCASCAAGAIEEGPRAQALAADVRRRMAAWGLVIPAGPIPLRVVAQDELDRLSGHPGRSSRCCRVTGLTRKRVALADGRVRGREAEIYILAGQPREAYEATVAHELMHAWILYDDQPRHAPRLEEGACNLAGYYIHQENATPLARKLQKRMWESRDPVYGEGLRLAVGEVQRGGFDGLVALLRQQSDFFR